MLTCNFSRCDGDFQVNNPPVSSSDYRRLLGLLSNYVPMLEHTSSADHALAVVETWLQGVLRTEVLSRTRLDSMEHELSSLQGLLGAIQNEFLIHLVQQQV